MSRCFGPREQEYAGFFGQFRRSLGTTVVQITQSEAALRTLHQAERRFGAIPIAGREHQIDNATRNVTKYMQFKAEEPALAGFAKP